MGNMFRWRGWENTVTEVEDVWFSLVEVKKSFHFLGESPSPSEQKVRVEITLERKLASEALNYVSIIDRKVEAETLHTGVIYVELVESGAAAGESDNGNMRVRQFESVNDAFGRLKDPILEVGEGTEPAWESKSWIASAPDSI